MKKIAKSLLTEYGVKWTINRALYSAKLKTMSAIPITENIYEKTVNIKRIDIFDFDIPSIQQFLCELPESDKTEIISTADKAINGVIIGFSSIELNYGTPFNWHYNPLTGFESRKDVKWFEIPDFDSKLGDIKVVWEASRFTHFFYLVRAYLLTKEMKYYRAFSSQLKNWLEQNPYPYGANFKCGQECTLRMINALMAYSVFKSLGITTKNDEENVKTLVKVCYKKVLSNFFYAHKCIKNNHTFTEICGLIVGAWCCIDNSGVKKGYKLMDKEIRNQFLSDGGFTQYSFNYHRFTLQIIECVYKISEKTQMYITETERIKKSILLLYQVQSIEGDVPNYGSNDGALIFPLTTCGYRDFRPVLNTTYALIEGNKIYNSGNHEEELLWFGRGEHLLTEKIVRKSTFLNESGFYIFHHNSGFLMTCLQNFKSRPAHMDQLHIDLWHKGINILCDSGTHSYASVLGKKLTSTAGHNTVGVSGFEQMNKKGAFLITDWTKRKDVHFGSTFFKGTMISKNGYEHTRHIQKYEKGYIISDDVFGAGKYCDFYFHTPCEVVTNASGFELYYKSKIICKIITDGDIEVEKVHRSLYYLKKEVINRVTVRSAIENMNCRMKFNIELIN